MSLANRSVIVRSLPADANITIECTMDVTVDFKDKMVAFAALGSAFARGLNSAGRSIGTPFQYKNGWERGKVVAATGVAGASSGASMAAGTLAATFGRGAFSLAAVTASLTPAGAAAVAATTALSAYFGGKLTHGAMTEPILRLHLEQAANFCSNWWAECRADYYILYAQLEISRKMLESSLIACDGGDITKTAAVYCQGCIAHLDAVIKTKLKLA